MLPKKYKSYWPKWLELSIGYAVRDILDANSLEGQGKIPSSECISLLPNNYGSPRLILALDYNLVKLFYLPGNSTLGISKDINKSIELLETIQNFEPANELFLYCYYELYLESKKEQYLEKIKHYLSIIDNYDTKKLKLEIENKLKEIYDYKVSINLS